MRFAMRWSESLTTSQIGVGRKIAVFDLLNIRIRVYEALPQTALVT